MNRPNKIFQIAALSLTAPARAGGGTALAAPGRPNGSAPVFPLVPG
jgi:hypothetical protein